MHGNELPRTETTDLIQSIKEEIKNDILNELLLARQCEMQRQPHIQDAESVPWSVQNVTREPNQMLADFNRGAGGKVLYGVGTVAVLGMFLPHFRRRVGNVVGRTALEGMDLFEQARAIIARAREDIEDIIAEANLRGFIKKSTK